VFQPGAPCAAKRMRVQTKLPVNCSRPRRHAGEPCPGADRPAHDSPQEPDSPAGLLDSAKASQIERARQAHAKRRPADQPVPRMAAA
jgi:hypothetical protein